MCIPQMSTPAPPPVAVPSMSSASSAILGGADRGAAQIGRLQLRLGGQSSSVTSPGASTGGSSSATTSALSLGPQPLGAQSQTAPPGAPSLPGAAPTSSSVVSGYNQANNALRLGNILVNRT